MSEHPEFLVSVELYLSNAATLALPKPISRKRRDKLDLSASSQPDDRRVKEKSSWNPLSKGLPEGPWRVATCKLSIEGDRCLLNIYLDVQPILDHSFRMVDGASQRTRLYQTVYIHLLKQTDIRQTDLSLFERKDCLSIYRNGNQRWASNTTAGPVYLHFFSNELCNMWLALLRSHAVPEIYGCFPADSYRMWRQLDLTIMQGRDLGAFKLSENANGETGELDVVDFAVSCHVRLNGIFCARTSEKRGTASPDWLENFTFSDLPPFGSLVLLIRREKKNMKSVGSVTIPLTHFPRGDHVEGWFPVLECSPASDYQIGELRLKLLVNEEIILPQSAYAPLLETLHSRNFLDWIDDFENKLKVKNVSAQLMSLAIDEGVAVSHVQELVARVINEAPSSHHILFRGNTPLTKVMELCMNWYGRAFLEISVGSAIRKLCKEKIAIEVDPARRNKGSRDIERNFELLTNWCKEFLDQIYAVRSECPQELRYLFETLRTLVEKRYKSELSKESHQNIHYRSVTAFCFLRFIVPAILNPHLFGFHLGMPPTPVHRSLTLIAKVLQSVANLNTTTTHSNIKEEYMRGMAGFISDNTPAMIDYILVVSTPKRDVPSQLQISYNKRRDQVEIEAHLLHRSSTMHVLEQEAIPHLPHLLDIPRHLAAVTSAVIRNSSGFAARTTPRDPSDRQLDDLCLRCLDIEEQALLCVSQVKAKVSPGRQSFDSSVNTSARQISRPATAPSTSYLNSPSGIPWTSTGVQHGHLKSASIESISSHGRSSSTQTVGHDSRREGFFSLKNILRR